MNPGSTAIVLLAAGSSSRMGTPKQLLQYGGRSLLRRAAETAIAARPAEVAVILGFEAETMRHECDDLPVRFVTNALWREGIASSIREGITSLSPSLDAALILLCDQPLITSTIINRLIESCQEPLKPIAAAEYGQSLGVPACFSRSIFPELLNLTGDTGAKRIIQLDRSRVATIAFPNGRLDIDTTDDLSSLHSQ